MKRPRPDTRPKWNDPDLLVIRDYKMRNGERIIEVDPDYERRYRAHMVEQSEQVPWRYDPTYNLRRKHR